MKKRFLSLFLAIVMVLSLVPTVALATVNEGDVCKIGETGYATLQTAVSTEGSGDITLLADVTESVDFSNETFTLDLNGFKLTGASTNAANVTIANSGAKKATLEATGVYANDCSTFAADGYAAVDSDKDAAGNDGKEVINNTLPGTFTVKVVTSIDDDRATTRTDATAAPGESGYVNEQDVYAGDTVKVEVRVYGARFVGMDVRLGYDTDKFDMTERASGWTGDDEESDDEATGFSRRQGAKAGTGNTYYELNKVDENGEYYYSLGEFKFVAKTCAEDIFDIPFTVKTEGSITHDKNAYIAGAWSQGSASTPATALADNRLVNARVNIRMVKMTVNISATSNLTYDTSAKNLVNSTYSVTDTLRNNAPVDGTTVKFILQTKEQAEGVQATDHFGDLLYYEDDGSGNATTTETTTKTNHPKYTTEPTPRGDNWSTTWPTATDASDYVIYYQVSKTGYATVEGKLENTIKKKEIDLTWTNGGFTKGTKAGTTENPLPPHGYYTEYSAGGESTAKAMPAASFIDGSNTTQNAIITVTKKDGAAPTTAITELKDVAVYELTATLPDAIKDNYIVKNPTINVLIDGSQITGYSLANKEGEGAEKWYDAQGHTPAKLVEEDGKTGDVTIKYTVLKDGVPMAGKTDIDVIPADLTEVGTYTVQATLTKTGYYDKTLTPVTFTIKSVEFKVEKADWVTGWDVVFVYTNTAGVHFTYDGKDMFDMSSLKVNNEKYEYNNTDEYTYVYGIAVYGDANTNLVVSSNGGVKDIKNTQDSAIDARCNINNTAPGLGATAEDRRGVDLNDLVACQAIYNVSEEYWKTKDTGTGTTEAPVLTEDIADAQMVIILKADVNGDKKVNTNDCSQIKAKSENN